MHGIIPILERLWKDENGISSVEYAMLLAMIGGGIIMAAEMLSNAIVNQFSDTAALLDGGSGGEGGAANCGSSGGEGAGSGNTCE